jgi:hypothetical protein
MYQIILFYVPYTTGLWIIEFAKEEVKRLYTILKRMGKSLITMNWRTCLKFNILEVPRGVPPQNWIRGASAVMNDSFHLPEGGRRLLAKAITSLYTRNGILAGSENYPDIYDLMAEVKTIKGEEIHPATKKSVLERLSSLIEGLGQNTLGYQKGYPIEQLEKMIINVQLEGMDFLEKCLIMNYYTTAALERRIANPNGSPPLLVAFEEAKALICRQRESTPDGPTHFTEKVEYVRGGNMRFLFVTQETNISKTVRNATALKIVGVLDHQELSNIAGSLSMTNEQITWFAEKAERRMFVGKANFGSFRKTFLFRAEELQIPDEVDEGEIDAGSREALDKLPVVPSPRFVHKPIEIIPAIMEEHTSATHEPLTESKKNTEILSSGENDYLMAIDTYPEEQITWYDAVAGMGRGKGQKTRESLLRKKLIEIHLVQTGGRKSYNIASITEFGAKFLPPGANVKCNHKLNRGGFVHNHKCNRIEEYFVKGLFITDREKDYCIDGDTFYVDIVATATNGMEKVAVEVQESTGNLRDNIEKCLKIGIFTKILIVLPTKKDVKENQLELADLLIKHPNVELCTLSRFISEEPL